MKSENSHIYTCMESNGQKEEREFILSLKAGDMDAYRILFSRYYPKFLHFATALTGRRDAAEDIMQDVFVKIWKNRGRLDENGSIHSYIYVLTKREILNYLRSRHISDPMPDDDGILSEDSVNNTVSAREMAAVVEGIVSEMPQPKRRIFIMNRFNGLSTKDIARIMSLSVRAVNYHIETALAFLKERLAGLK